jgi:hypothetical protein
MAFPATAHAQKYTGQQIFVRYPSASAIGFATIPGNDPDGLSLAAVNRMIEGAIRGVQRREDGES